MKRFVTVFLLLISVISFSQTNKNKPTKYPSLMWEISGNGLQKPSYLFGTMHVSNKMVFHLSDSFYTAMKSCDAVSLELNPQTWQPEMFRLEQAQRDINNYTYKVGNDYLTEKSFRLEEYDDNLKKALSEEPTQVNGLLYRSYQPAADFEENTYLDLYIYQTGRKLGKQAAGVENFMESQKLMMEAYADMAKEKKKKTSDTDNENYYDINKKIQDAYRRGDLDLLDSLEKFTSTSEAFNEKFLYKRNEIQANAMDSIMKYQTLFVGVGAAHLPGDRGVIEILRKKGYTLRPIKMVDRDAEQKEKVDKMRVPIIFKLTQTPDGFIKVSVPGKLYKRTESRRNQSWQYADMENGSYYMVTRVATHAAMLGQKDEDVVRKIDSLLYEYIPGKIQSKKSITKNGYKGFDITNKTKRGDIQRYNILVTPFEVLVFKMSGNDDYVVGKEADEFFNSVSINELKNGWTTIAPATKGFVASFYQQPHVVFNGNAVDGNDTWEYEATDKQTGDAYLLWKKGLNNYRFLEEDTFDISLVEESFIRSELVEKELSRKPTIVNGYAALDFTVSMKTGDVVKARAIVKGNSYYLLAARGKKVNPNFDKFLNSFSVNGFVYQQPITYIDTSFKFTVQTPVLPVIDNEIRSMFEKAQASESLYSAERYSNYPKERNAVFVNDTTGETIAVSVKTFPEYYFKRDSAKFWKDQINWEKLKKDLIVKQKDFVQFADSVAGYKFVLEDTNSTRKLIGQMMLKDNMLFTLTTQTDTKGVESNFINTFFSTFRPLNIKLGVSVFENKLNHFFEDYYSSDSLTKKKANSAISSIYFGPKGFPYIKTAIEKLKFGDKDYFELKNKFISELGYIDDSTCVTNVVATLKNLYSQTADTSLFQNNILAALAKLQTKESYTLLKEFLLQDPPVFTSSFGIRDIFGSMDDSLSLAKTMFPEILQLSTLEDYKKPINSLLKALVDSGYMKATDYESYYNKIYFDAKIELKKQQSRDEKLLEKESSKDEDNNNGYRSTYNYNNLLGGYGSSYNNNSSEMGDYAALLIPFYDKHLAVPKYFDKLLKSKDKNVQLAATYILLKNNKTVNDSILQNIAATDEYRAVLLKQLEKLKKPNLFPATYKTQQEVAKAILLNDKSFEKFKAIELVGKQTVTLKNTKGVVYFFKYKIKQDDDWLMGISGIQPENEKEVSSNNDIVIMTQKKLKADEPIIEQYEKKLKQMLFAKRKSSARFFNDRDYRGQTSFDYNIFNRGDDDE